MLSKLLTPLLLTSFSLTPVHASLTIAANLAVIEYTPMKIALEDFYPTPPNITIINGGVPNLFSANTTTLTDLASNAETQALRSYPSHRNLRTIYTISEVAYRLVTSSPSSLHPRLESLKGKRIGTIPATSAGYFVEALLDNAGVSPSSYTVVSGAHCLAAPCANDTLPAMLASGRVDAVALWEPTVELAARALRAANNNGTGVVFFQDEGVYREIYSLYSTAETLADPVKRGEVVRFVGALDRAVRVFEGEMERVVGRVARAVVPAVEEGLLRDVWGVHGWKGGLPADLLDVLVREDAYVARVEGRERLTRRELEALVDRSVLREVRGEDGEEEEEEER
ncbi:hypothetical protein BU24DRAFT_462023 [Aaosphaeria arxii CBS 175.79]|uniref:SsuA/THI5-like domain-containing protein n=1 Tax=Aaosphaeria arxii CBS 175.79 TaxID=1450172 RepID=A0A6A5XR92_9PLEO|nr:uncharacterized protein BU24DRAFT_462023 [Aaosphaeria arxii CBS 175.79]KAF2015798.1 hypothetical protein BU24DRAFT_462023 [Aaosphaeria arxii CBS 175.79]